LLASSILINSLTSLLIKYCQLHIFYLIFGVYGDKISVVLQFFLKHTSHISNLISILSSFRTALSLFLKTLSRQSKN